MKHSLSENSAVAISESVTMMDRHRKQLTEELTTYMSRCSPEDSLSENHGEITRAIMDMLFDNVREVGAVRPLHRMEESAWQHRLLGLSTKHYSCFGDGLRATMKDVIGREASRSLLGAWTDAYWSFVRAIMRDDLSKAA